MTVGVSISLDISLEGPATVVVATPESIRTYTGSLLLAPDSTQQVPPPTTP